LAHHIAVCGDQLCFIWIDLESMDGDPKKRRRYRWPKEARDLVTKYLSRDSVKEYLRTDGALDYDPAQGTPTFRVLVTRLHQLTGYPRERCLDFARQLGVKDRQRYAEWTTVEQQKLLDLIALHPPQEIAQLMRRSIGSIRGMLHRLDATTQMGREWFSAYTLAEALHIRVQEVQRWIAQGWLKSRIVKTGKLNKHIIDPDDFAEFYKLHHKEVIGRRLNADRLEFVHKHVFPPSHVELLPARDQGYKTRRKLAASVQEEARTAQTGFKFEPDFDLMSSGYREANASESA
jgi:hypothetical protein